MFGLGGGELLIVCLLAALLIGPRDLPKVARQIGRWVAQFKGAALEIKDTVEREVQEGASLDEAPKSPLPKA